MRLETRRLRLGVLIALLLLAPFGEGGAGAGVLLLNQTLVALAWVSLLVSRVEMVSSRLPRRMLAAIACFLFIALLSGSLSAYPYASFLRILDLATFAAVLLLSGSAEWSREDEALMADSLLASAALQSGMVIVSWMLGMVGAAVAGAGLLNPNHEAAYLLLAALVTLPGLLQQPPGASRRVRGGALLLTAIGFCLLASRGALLGLLAACGLWALRRARLDAPLRRRGFAVLLGGILLAGVAGVAVRFWRVEDPYRYQRLRIWQADLRTFAESPLIGVGPGMFRHVAPSRNFPLPGPVRFGRSFQTPHSDLLGCLAETGLLGLGAALLALIAAMRQLAAKASVDEELAFGALLALAGLAAQGLVEDLTLRPGILITLAVILGPTLSGERGAIAQAEASRRSLLRAWLAAAAIAFFWFLAALRPFLAYRSDVAMRRATTYAAMEDRFEATVWRNPYQALTYLYPASLFLAARPEQPLALDLYLRFRRDLDQGIALNRASADARLVLARLEGRAFRELFRDAPTRDRSLEAYRGAVLRAPHDPRIRVELAGMLHDVGRTAESIRQMVLALHEEPMYLGARYLLSRLLLESGDAEGARREYQKAEEARAALASYEPDSPYARDISRDPTSLRNQLQTQLAGR